MTALTRRAEAWLARHPRARKALPWAGALALNLLLAGSLFHLAVPDEPRGRLEPKVANVFVVPTRPAEAERYPEIEATPSASDTTAVAEEEEGPVPAPEGELAEQPAATAVPAGRSAPVDDLPSVAVPEVDQPTGDPAGIIALNCYQFFSDPDKAAECAGREVLSGWQAEINGGEDWGRIAEDLRRGGYARPSYGPDALAGMGENTTVYERADPRFRDRTFDPTPRRFREAFDSPEELAKFDALRDPRKYASPFNQDAFADNGTRPIEPLSGWAPSWMLRDDPDIDQKDLGELLRRIEENDKD
ncbi:hypothetical protein [Parvularcula sp. LCG005]|uniref:hypothetical protein n=1 Tax=Parvularcula sp. LCG005 TaxID=3078805 RepID=UPI0029433F4F|nr:hypothetical protein [Parvularcula sp. LCG005]WOI52628.1 hypothetical protein RUI03_10765 [Parvularcula sp. LCG005]